MNISILDLDYYHRFSFEPSSVVMQLSSYLKQQGHHINFIENELHMKMNFDECYIFRVRPEVPAPPTFVLDNMNTKLIGETFKFFKGYEKLPPVVYACRPDYSIYTFEEETPYTKAEFIQFFHEGKLIKKRQDYHNLKKGRKKLIVMDKDFWSASEEDILFALEALKQEKNIEFKYPIKLKLIMSKPAAKLAFLDLHFSRGTIMRFQNNVGHSLEQLREVIDFVSEFGKNHSNLAAVRLHIAGVTGIHFDNRKLAQEDFERSLRVIDYAKSKNVRIIVKAPKDRKFTPWWPHFEFLQVWTTHYYHKSFVDAILSSTARRHKVEWYEVLNDSTKWFTPRSKIALSLLNRRKDFILKYGFRTMEDKYDDVELIDWTEVEKFIFKSSIENGGR